MVETKIRQLYQVIAEIEEEYPEKHFTLDGILLGNLGEVYASEAYGLRLLPEAAERLDAVTADDRFVQIKTTQRNRVGFYSEPDYLLVLQVQPDGRIIEIYNGPGAKPWQSAGKENKSGQRCLSVARLKRLQMEPHEKIPQVN